MAFKENLSSEDMLSMLQTINESLVGYNLDITNDADWRSMITDADSRKIYVDTLAEGLSPADSKKFDLLCENITSYSSLNESNTSAGFLPQAKLVMPLFRFMWPRLIMKEFGATCLA